MPTLEKTTATSKNLWKFMTQFMLRNVDISNNLNTFMTRMNLFLNVFLFKLLITAYLHCLVFVFFLLSSIEEVLSTIEKNTGFKSPNFVRSWVYFLFQLFKLSDKLDLTNSWNFSENLRIYASVFFTMASQTMGTYNNLWI